MKAKEVRLSIGGDILVSMAGNNEFPIQNIHRLSKKMQEYFNTEGFEEDLIELGYKWRPKTSYWAGHQQEIREYLRREKKLYLEYRRDNGSLVGAWQFLRKKEFQEVMRKELANMKTRETTYNRRLSDGYNKWQLDLPFLRFSEIEAPQEDGVA